jgi:hypothetical protein
MTPDVNVLVAASRSDHPHHAVARAWLETALAAAGTSSGPAFTLMPMVVVSFDRDFRALLPRARFTHLKA